MAPVNSGARLVLVNVQPEMEQQTQRKEHGRRGRMQNNRMQLSFSLASTFLILLCYFSTMIAAQPSSSTGTASPTNSTLELPDHSYDEYVRITQYYPDIIGFLLFILMYNLPNALVILLTDKLFGFTHVIGMASRPDEDEDTWEDNDTTNTKQDAEYDRQLKHSSYVATKDRKSAELKEKLLQPDSCCGVMAEPEESPPPSQHQQYAKQIELSSNPRSAILTGSVPGSDEFSLASPSPGDFNFTSSASQQDLILQPLQNRVWFLSVQVDLSEEETRDSKCDKMYCFYGRLRMPKSFVTMVHCLVHATFLCKPCRSHSALVGHDATAGVWLRRYIKVIIWLIFWTCLVFWIDQGVLFKETMTLSHTTRSNTDIRCPAEASNGGQADCFDGGGDHEYLPCHIPDAYLPKGISTIECYELRPITMLTILYATSIAAGLLTLIFGGLIFGFSLCLGQVKKRWISWMKLIPLGFFIIYFVTQIYVQRTGVSALGVLFPIVCCILMWILIKMRATLEELKELHEKQFEPEEVVWN